MVRTVNSAPQAPSLRSTFGQVGYFLAYVARNFPLLHAVVGLTALVLLFEYAATSLMLPLASSGAAQERSAVIAFWRDAANLLGLSPTQHTWLWLFIVLMAARLALGYLQLVLATLLGKRIHRHLSGTIFRHVVSHEPLKAVYERSVGYYITLAGDDTFRCGTIVSNLLQAAVGLCTALVALVVLHQFSTPTFYLVVAFLVACGAVTLFLLRHMIRLTHNSNARSRELGTYFVESLNSLRSIRSLHGQTFVQQNYAAQIARYVRILLSIESIKSGAKAFPPIALLLITAIVLRPDANVSTDAQFMFAATVIVIRVFAALGQFISAATPLLTDMRAVGDIRQLTDASAGVPEDTYAISKEPVRSIALQDIRFSYDGRAPVLKDVSFRFDAGKTYAVVGPSGVGKSTLADVLLGLAVPQAGSLLVNGSSWEEAKVRGRLMLVEQQPKVFSTTLRENLLFGHLAPDSEVWLALKLVDLESHVRAMPLALDTPLTYLGENLSGGQRQRLGIARALIRRPDVLILDEATSALDPATRSMVVGNIRRHMEQGVIIFITHDNEIAGLADAILAVTPGDESRSASPDGQALQVTP